MSNEVDWIHFNQIALCHQNVCLGLGKIAMIDINYHF